MSPCRGMYRPVIGSQHRKGELQKPFEWKNKSATPVLQKQREAEGSRKKKTAPNGDASTMRHPSPLTSLISRRSSQFVD